MQPNASQISDDQIHKPGRPIFDGLFVQTFVPTIIYLSHTLESQSEDIELKFRATGVDPMVILDSRALPIVRNTENIGTIRHLGKKNLAEGRQAIALAVVNGELWLTIAFGSLQNQVTYLFVSLQNHLGLPFVQNIFYRAFFINGEKTYKTDNGIRQKLTVEGVQ